MLTTALLVSILVEIANVLLVIQDNQVKIDLLLSISRETSIVTEHTAFIVPDIYLFSAWRLYVPRSSFLAWWTTRVVMAPPWYSSVLTVKSWQSLSSPWTGCHQVNTGGGSPRHLICQNAVLPVRTVLEPA